MEDEEARAAFVSIMEAEERVKLMTALLSKKVGTPDVENFYRKQLQHCRVGYNKTERNSKQIRFSRNNWFLFHLFSVAKVTLE